MYLCKKHPFNSLQLCDTCRVDCKEFCHSDTQTNLTTLCHNSLSNTNKYIFLSYFIGKHVQLLCHANSYLSNLGGQVRVAIITPFSLGQVTRTTVVHFFSRILNFAIFVVIVPCLMSCSCILFVVQC